MTLSPADRRNRIADLVGARAKVGVDDLAVTLGVSRETIRRDLTHLDRRGLVRKQHGGATPPDARPAESRGEGPFHARMLKQAEEKRAIARRAAILFQSGDTLFIDAGTTTLFFAEELSRRPGLTIFTNSIPVAQIIGRGDGGSAVFLIGGEYRDDVGENLGPIAIEQIARCHAAHAVLTIGALDASGAMDYDSGETGIARAMAAQARHLTVLADSSKLGRSGLFQVCQLTDIDRLVTDRAPEGAIADALAEADIEVIVAAQKK